VQRVADATAGKKGDGDVSKRGGNKSKRPVKPAMANKGPKPK
jgi:hypothetical protein